MVVAEVTVQFNTKCYSATVANSLDWVPPTKKTKLSIKQKPRKEISRKRNQQRYLEGLYALAKWETCFPTFR